MENGADAELRTRARQQAAVAELGQRALGGTRLEELVPEAVRVAARELGTEFASVLELTADGKMLKVLAAIGIPEGTELSAGEELLQGYALRANGPVISEDLRSETRFQPSDIQRELGVVSAMAAPIGVRGRHFGVLGAHSREPRHFSRDDASFAQALANVIGAAVDRARSEELIRDSEARFRELADTAPAIMWMTDTEGEVIFVNREWLRFTGKDPQEVLGPSWTVGAHPDDADRVLSSWLDALRRREPWEIEYRLERHDGAYRWIVARAVPRYEDGVFAGYVGTATDIHERRAMEERLRTAHEREQRVAETLQRSLLPESLPEIEGIELAARYLPAGPGTEVGGDWYDALDLPDGRVALVVGDVVGHGLRAAAMMGQMRNACRAYALVEPSPPEVLAHLNRLVVSGGQDVMATVLYLVLDRDTGEVVFTNAGHPPPLVLTPDGPEFLQGGRSVPIGASDPSAFREGRATIPQGSTLLLYTDGLVERRDVPLDDRLAQLRAAAAAAGGELSDVCDQVLRGVLGSRAPSDDVALLAVRPEPLSAGRLELSLPAEPDALSGLRRRLQRFLHAAGASDEEAYEITLTVSEAAGNAIEHAYGPGDEVFEVEAQLEDGEVVACVRDTGSWRERRGDNRGRGLHIIEGLMDDVEVSTAPGGGTVVRMRKRLGGRREPGVAA
jgi:PAS domain S-box-containing protein